MAQNSPAPARSDALQKRLRNLQIFRRRNLDILIRALHQTDLRLGKRLHNHRVVRHVRCARFSPAPRRPGTRDGNQRPGASGCSTQGCGQASPPQSPPRPPASPCPWRAFRHAGMILFHCVKGAGQDFLMDERADAVVDEYITVLFFLRHLIFQRLQSLPDRGIALRSAFHYSSHLAEIGIFPRFPAVRRGSRRRRSPEACCRSAGNPEKRQANSKGPAGRKSSRNCFCTFCRPSAFPGLPPARWPYISLLLCALLPTAPPASDSEPHSGPGRPSFRQ